MSEKNDMGIWRTIVLLAGGGGGYTTYDLIKEHAISEGNKIWVTLASQNLETRFNIEDELAEIQRKIDKGEETTGDLIRKAVLEERLKQLELK